MATKNIVPNADGEGKLGTSSKSWAEGHIDSITGTIATATQGSITSLGTLTGLTVSGNVGVGGSASSKLNVIDSASGAAIKISGAVTDTSVSYYGFMHDGTDLQGTTQVNLFYAEGAIKADTTVTDFASFRISAPSTSASNAVITNNYAIYQASSAQKNYFGGNIILANDNTIGSAGTADGIKINSSGHVGINSSSTSLVYPLEVYGGNGDAIIFKDTANSVTTWLGAFGGAAVAGALTSGDDFALYAGNAEKVRIASTGEMIYNSGGFIDFDGQSLQLNTQRNPNSGTFNDTNKSNAAIGLNGANGASEIIFKTAAANNTTATTRFTIKSDGNVEIANGSLIIANAGDGINFGATSDASGSSSEVLDDFEEGSWTPTLSTSGGSVGTASSAGQYTKIGRQVIVHFQFTLSSSSGGSGTLKITNLPFTVDANSGAVTGSGRILDTANTISVGHFTSTHQISLHLYNGNYAGTDFFTTGFVTYFLA